MASILQSQGEEILGINVQYAISTLERLIRGEADIITKKAVVEVKNYNWGRYSKYLLERVKERFAKQVVSRKEFIASDIARTEWGIAPNAKVIFYLSDGAPPEIVSFLEGLGVIVKTFP